MLSIESLRSTFDPATGIIDGAPRTERRLADLAGIFACEAAYTQACAAGNPLVYSVYAVEPGSGDGDLHYGIGMIMPGRVGNEYYMTKGHLHAWRPAAEFYIGLAGSGLMLLEDEATGQSRLLALEPNSVVYVPGGVAHRTINSGNEPLVYAGVYPARAGHDYAAIAERNFAMVVAEIAGKPTAMERREYLESFGC